MTNDREAVNLDSMAEAAARTLAPTALQLIHVRRHRPGRRPDTVDAYAEDGRRPSITFHPMRGIEELGDDDFVSFVSLATPVVGTLFRRVWDVQAPFVHRIERGSMRIPGNKVGFGVADKRAWVSSWIEGGWAGESMREHIRIVSWALDEAGHLGPAQKYIGLMAPVGIPPSAHLKAAAAHDPAAVANLFAPELVQQLEGQSIDIRKLRLAEGTLLGFFVDPDSNLLGVPYALGP